MKKMWKYLLLSAAIVLICGTVYYFMSKRELLKIGDVAPEFSLVNQNGASVNLSDYKGKKNVVLFFYPKDQTSGCTKEACSFRDNYETIVNLGAEVIGINGDGTSSHKSFADKHNLPYDLVTDVGSNVRKAYGVPSFLFFMPARVSFVIGKDGLIKSTIKDNADPQHHIDNAIGVLKTL